MDALAIVPGKATQAPSARVAAPFEPDLFQTLLENVRARDAAQDVRPAYADRSSPTDPADSALDDQDPVSRDVAAIADDAGESPDEASADGAPDEAKDSEPSDASGRSDDTRTEDDAGSDPESASDGNVPNHETAATTDDTADAQHGTANSESAESAPTANASDDSAAANTVGLPGPALDRAADPALASARAFANQAGAAKTAPAGTLPATAAEQAVQAATGQTASGTAGQPVVAPSPTASTQTPASAVAAPAADLPAATQTATAAPVTVAPDATQRATAAPVLTPGAPAADTAASRDAAQAGHAAGQTSSANNRAAESAAADLHQTPASTASNDRPPNNSGQSGDRPTSGQRPTMGQAAGAAPQTEAGAGTSGFAQTAEPARAADALRPADPTTTTQPTAAAPGTGSSAAANRMSTVLPVQARPAPAAVPIDQVAVHIQRATAAGENRIRIALHPAELGQIDVKLALGSDGAVKAIITVDRADTLDLLQRDARGLERALQDAGLKTESGNLSFHLRDEGRNGFGGREDGMPDAAGGDETGDLAQNAGSDTETAVPPHFVSTRALNMVV